MKRYINNIGKMVTSLLFASVVASVTLTACSFEDEDFFDESASLRIEHTNQAIQNILVNAPNGWVMQYYTGTGVAHFEGFNLFAKFEDSEKVLLASDHRLLRDGKANKYTEYSSLYEMLLEDGPVLAFNTWNDVLSPFVDPVSPWQAPDAIVKDGAGMQGDNNFVVMSYNDDEIILNGERYRAEVRLAKCDRTWEEYIADTKAMKDNIANPDLKGYVVTNEVDSMYFVGLHRGIFRYCERVNDPLKIDSLACCFTPDGFRLEHENTLGENTFQEFKLSDDGTCLLNEDGTVKVVAMWEDYLAEKKGILWIDAESLSENLRILYDQLDAALKASNRNYSLSRIGIGQSNGRIDTQGNYVIGLVVEWYTNTRKTSSAKGGLALKRSVPAGGQITITCTEDANLDNNMRARSAEVIEAVRALGAALSGTYNVIPTSNYFTPDEASYVSLDGNTSFSTIK